MNVDYESIEELFRVQDVDYLISAGAPDDEYELEVEMIFVALEALPLDQVSVPKLIQIFDDVFTKTCGDYEKDRMRRASDFEEIAEKVMKFFA